MRRTANPITKSGAIIIVSGLEQAWETFSGIKEQTQTTEYNDGIANMTFNLPGRRKMEPFTVTKPFDPVADRDIVEYWQLYSQGRLRGNKQVISVVPVEYRPDPVPIGASMVVYGVIPTSFEGFETDRKSSDIMPLSLALVGERWTYS